MSSRDTCLLNLLGDRQLNGVGDELGVLLDDLLDALLLKVLGLVLLEVKADLGTTTKRRIDGVGSDGECTASRRLPNILLIVVVLRDNLHPLSDQVGQVEANTKLTNHGYVGASTHSLHEAL